MVLRWLDAALADLRAIKAYIAEENIDAARCCSQFFFNFSG